MASMHTEDIALWSKIPINTAEEKITWVTHRPVYQKPGGYTSVEFSIQPSSTQYIDLKRSKLHMITRVKKSDGSKFKKQPRRAKRRLNEEGLVEDDSEEDDTITEETEEFGVPIDMIFHTMWSSMDVSLNQTLVSTSGNNYMYKAFLETMLNYSKNAKKYQLTGIGYTGDKGNFHATQPKEPPLNQGLLARYNDLFGDGESVELIGPLLADICNQDRAILNGVEIAIKLWPNKDKFRLMTHPKNLECELIIDDIYLEVCKINVASEVMLAHQEALKISPCLYPHQRNEIKAFSIPKNQYTATLENMFQSKIPTRMLMAMVTSDNYTGNYSKNPLMLQHFDISTVGFYVDGEPIPNRPYKLDVAGGKFLQAWSNLYSLTGKSNHDTDIGITRQLFRDGMCIIPFDVDPTAAADLSYMGVTKIGHTRLELEFKNPLPESIIVILYATFYGEMRIDEARNVTIT